MGAGAYIEKKLVAIPQFNKPTGCCLLGARAGHSGTTTSAATNAAEFKNSRISMSFLL
jgi:hypothetical protein